MYSPVPTWSAKDSRSFFRSAAHVVLAVLLLTPGWITAQVKSLVWGQTADGADVSLYMLHSASLDVRITSYGARIVSVRAPDRNGKKADVVLGYDSLAEYLAESKTHFGTTVGRFGNRIAGGRFILDGHAYSIPANSGKNALHGGPFGFDRHVWMSRAVHDGVEFRLISPDGDMGFPGTLIATVTYTLHRDTLRIDYTATTDRATVVNLTNHSYFNLSGGDSSTILEQRIAINANGYTPVNADLIPTGQIAPVRGTPFDFTQTHAIGERVEAADPQLILAGGYDHNFVLVGESGQMKLAARVDDPVSGRILTVSTTEPAVQFYSGNHLDGTYSGRHGIRYVKNSGLCLETQHFPDSPNEPTFPSTVLRPGDTFHSTTTFTFTTERQAKGSVPVAIPTHAESVRRGEASS